MKKLITQLKIKPFTAVVALAVVFFLGNAIRMTSAQVSGSGPVPLPFVDATVEPNNACEPAMKSFADKELKDFRDFLEVNFQNKSSTGSLLEAALDKYREMRTQLYNAYSQYAPNNGSLQLTAGLEPGKCEQIIVQTLDDAKIALKTHAVTTSGVKKTTALLEKYQQINGELANLFQQFVYMKAYLDTFSGKMPCYPKSACLKG